MKPFKYRSCRRTAGQREGYSLVEMLAVVAILGIMAALLLPAVAAFDSTAARKGAVNIVMNTIDQARVAALERGKEIHIVFAQRRHPEPDSLLVLSEDENGSHKPLTRWITLPRGVIFMDTGIFEAGASDVNPKNLPGDPGSVLRYGQLTFSSRGTVQFPSGGDDNRRRIKLADGVRTNGSGRATLKTDGLDIISVARFTGRPQLDVTF